MAMMNMFPFLGEDGPPKEEEKMEYVMTCFLFCLYFVQASDHSLKPLKKFPFSSLKLWYCRVNVEMITPALKIWRDAVLTAQSAAQLSMCLSMLYDCVAWEKSIMKVVSVKRDVVFSMVTRQSAKVGESPNAPSRSRFYGIIIGYNSL